MLDRRFRPIGELGCVLLLLTLVWGSANAAGVAVKGTLESAADVRIATSGKELRFPDGGRQDTANPGYQRTLVLYGLGTPAENGTALLAALAAVTGTAENPRLLKIEPGVYDLGSSRLQMKAHIDIEGSGETLTRITGKIDHATEGVVCGASDASLRLLTVENTGGGSTAIAVSNLNASTRVVRVRAVASGADANIGMLNDQGSEPVLNQVAAEASGGTTAYGIKNVTVSVVMAGVETTATGAATNYAIHSSTCEIFIQDVTATASGGTTNIAVASDYAYAGMARVSAAATGGTRAVAVSLDNNSHADVSDLTATAISASDVNTAFETRESSAILRWVQAEAKGPGTCHGILNTDGTAVTMFHVNILAAEGTGAYAIHSDDTPLSMYAVTATADAATTSNGYGLYVLGATHGVEADNCRLAGSGWSVFKVADAVVRMGACLLEGPVNKVEQYQCAQCFTAAAVPLGDECQPLAP